MKAKRGTQEDLSHSEVSGTIYWEGICFRGGRSKFRFGHAVRGMPVRHPSGDIKKASEYMNLELSEDLGQRYKYERHSCVVIFKVIYNRTN